VRLSVRRRLRRRGERLTSPFWTSVRSDRAARVAKVTWASLYGKTEIMAYSVVEIVDVVHRELGVPVDPHEVEQAITSLQIDGSGDRILYSTENPSKRGDEVDSVTLVLSTRNTLLVCHRVTTFEI
jgi:hypothetical protein